MSEEPTLEERVQKLEVQISKCIMKSEEAPVEAPTEEAPEEAPVEEPTEETAEEIPTEEAEEETTEAAPDEE